jgi:hypothetical protein
LAVERAIDGLLIGGIDQRPTTLGTDAGDLDVLVASILDALVDGNSFHHSWESTAVNGLSLRFKYSATPTRSLCSSRPAKRTPSSLAEEDNIQHILASLALKVTRQSVIIAKLSSYPRKNRTKKGAVGAG